MPLTFGTLSTAVAALLGVVALVILAGRAARLTRFARPEPGRRLAIQEILSLDRTRRLMLVRCDGRDVLLLTGTASDTVIGWLPGTGTAP